MRRHVGARMRGHVWPANAGGRSVGPAFRPGTLRPRRTARVACERPSHSAARVRGLARKRRDTRPEGRAYRSLARVRGQKASGITRVAAPRLPTNATPRRPANAGPRLPANAGGRSVGPAFRPGTLRPRRTARVACERPSHSAARVRGLARKRRDARPEGRAYRSLARVRGQKASGITRIGADAPPHSPRNDALSALQHPS